MSRSDQAGAKTAPGEKIRVGVSSCLLGQPVRHDAGHKLDRNVTGILALRFELVAVCPEVEVGMGVPREPVHLVRSGNDIRMVGARSGNDHTDAMRRYAAGRVAGLAALGICGCILKKNSPSCGPDDVATFAPDGAAAPPDRGLFAAALQDAMPRLPVEDEARLGDAALREAFIERVLAYARARASQPAPR